MMLTLTDLRYLLRLVKVDYFDGKDLARSLRVEKKLVEIISQAKSPQTAMLETETVADQGGRCVGPWTMTIFRLRGGDTMGKASEKHEVPIDAHVTMLLRATINKIRMVISNVEDSLDALIARRCKGERIAMQQYLTKREGVSPIAKTQSKAAAKPVGKTTKRK